MNFTKVVIINSVFALVGGLGLLFLPDQMMSPYGITLGIGGRFIAQLFSLVMLGIAVMYWSLQHTKDEKVKIALSHGALLPHIGAALAGILYMKLGLITNLILIDVAIHTVLALGFWYYGLYKKER